jgi:hypothetical protein
MSEDPQANSAIQNPEAPPLPELSVDVRTFDLEDIFLWLGRHKKSGRVEFSFEDSEKQAYLHNGEVVFACSNQSIDRLGECLLRAGVIQLEQLREAERCYKPPARFGRVLVERGFLTPRELWNGVKYQVEEIVRSLFSYQGGRLQFYEGAAQPDNVVRLSLGTSRLASEGMMRRDELANFRALLVRGEVTLAVDADVVPRLSPPEREIADRIAEGATFEELSSSLPFQENELLRYVQLLRLVGALQFVRMHSAPDVVSAADLEAFRREELERTAHSGRKLIAALAKELVSVDGDGAVRERLTRALEDAAAHYPEVLGGLPLSAELSVSGEEIAARASRLAADGEEIVRGALGELVAYLEFEVKNHPGIEAPDSILESIRSACPWEA